MPWMSLYSTEAELESVGLVEILKDFVKRNVIVTFFFKNYWLQFGGRIEF